MALAKNLPDHVKAYIERQVAEGRFETEEAVIVDAVEHVMETSYRWEEDQELLAAIAEYERDGGETVTDIRALLDRLSKEARENSRQGVPVPYDVTY